MKAAMILFVTIMVLVTNAHAEPPYARTCRVKGGQQWTVDLKLPTEVMLCMFNSAAIGAAEFAMYKWNKGMSQSLTAFFAQNTLLNSSTICQDQGAAQRISQDSEGSPWRLCVFADGSVIEANTLAYGTTSPMNAALVEALR
jgi:putative hemolysin